MNRARLLVLPVVLALGLGVPASPSGAAPPAAVPEVASEIGRGHAHTHGPDGLDLDRRRKPGTATVAQPIDGALTDSTWSTTEEPLSQVGTDQPDRLVGLPSVHLVYVYPSDLSTPRTKFLNMFEADARAAQRFLQAKYGRSVRFDESATNSSRTGLPRLDITTLKSKYRTSTLGGSRQFDLVKDDLARAFPDSDSPRKKYIAWLDAPSKYCGQGELYGDWHRDKENWNDLRTTGIVYRPYDKNNPEGGFCRGRTLLHELGHNLGALYKGAPNAFDGAHCNDDKNDAMCYQGNSTFDSSKDSTGEFDYGNNDYWDAGAGVGSDNGGPKDSLEHLRHLNWWTVNLSRFVCRPAGDGSTTTAACDDPNTVHPSDNEFRYHSSDEAYPPPASVPTT